MTYTLLVYDRGRGQLVHDESFHSRADALQARFRVEHERLEEPMEVVVLASTSREDLMRTHSRYFRSLDDLAHPAE